MATTSELSTSSSPVSFAFGNHQIRATVIDESPWFVARDVCAALTITWRGFDTLKVIPEAWKGVRKLRTPSKELLGIIKDNRQETIVISEPAVYKLAFRSNKPEADKFTNWVASEVLPAIRKTGTYSVVPQVEAAEPIDRLTTGAERKNLAIMRAQIMGHGPSTPGYCKFSRTMNKALGINAIAELPHNRLAAVEDLYAMIRDFALAGRQGDSQIPGALPHDYASLSRSEKVHVLLDAYEKTVEHAGKASWAIEQELLKIIKETDIGPGMDHMQGMHVRQMIQDMRISFSNAMHAVQTSLNTVRPTFWMLAAATKMGEAIKSALPAGRGRPRKALTA